ncbi:MAG: hypothetical protein ACRD2X_11950 [Vicinamibacteraceae bacterium]
MTGRHSRTLLLAVLVALSAACATRARSIGDIQTNPARYHDRRVVVDGTVATSYGSPFLPYQLYKIEDDTGEIFVVSQERDGWTPTRGAHVRVKGRVQHAGVLGGRAIGVHIASRDLDVVDP